VSAVFVENNFCSTLRLGVLALNSAQKPAGDQPQAIEKLTAGILSGAKHQTLLGVTGSGKTFTVANVIKNVNKPTLVISHNKTLAAQLYAEFKVFFPNNAVEYFVSYFDYYQPEAYIPRTDTFIEKDSSRNEEIERLRLSDDEFAVHAARRGRGRQRLVHLRHRQQGGLRGAGHPMRVGQEFRANSFWRAWWICNTTATTSRSSAAISACAATRWKSGPPDARTACASNFSATKSSAHALRAVDRKQNRIARADMIFPGETIRHDRRQNEARHPGHPRGTRRAHRGI
jgi:hypothetical protein